MTADIPRLYTALAEWCACLLYLQTMTRTVRGWRLVAASAGLLALQSMFLGLTGSLPISFWIPCMALAVGFLFLFLFLCGNRNAADAGYCCVRAFALAELAASLEWQIHCFFLSPTEFSPAWLALLAAIYGAVFWAAYALERRCAATGRSLAITRRELGSTIVIGVAVFAISNLGFLSIRTPISGQHQGDMLSIRTLVDLGGVAILFAHHIQCWELRLRQELEAVQNVLQNQYLQYQQSKESIDIVNRKYHDLKHQIAVLREERDPAKRSAFLDAMEQDIRNYEAQNKTGNPVVDTMLTSKSLYCAGHGITLTCVADGRLLDFMDVMDICTIFGNALDNAIECVEKLEPPEKRLIHVTVSARKGFVLLRFENYCEEVPTFDDDLPVTTKGDAAYHGYGLKSMRLVARKYGGTLTVQVKRNWFEVKVLIPRESEKG